MFSSSSTTRMRASLAGAAMWSGLVDADDETARVAVGVLGEREDVGRVPTREDVVAGICRVTSGTRVVGRLRVDRGGDVLGEEQLAGQDVPGEMGLHVD